MSLDKYEMKFIILNIVLGIFLALLVAEFVYQPPSYKELITKGSFQVVTIDGKYLGNGISALYVIYEPNPWGTSLGEFSFPIKTYMVEPMLENRSIFLKDVIYEVCIWWKGKLIETRDSHYLGSLNIENKHNEFFNILFMPKTEYTFQKLNKAHGLVTIEVTGRIYNQTNGNSISSGKTTLSLFIFYPYSRLLTSSILLFVFFLKLYWGSNCAPACNVISSLSCVALI